MKRQTAMTNGHILWVDDEVELLKAYIIFLKNKGYEVTTVTNGVDAIEACSKQTFDMVMLDEMMPGLTGLETLQRIKEVQPSTPVVMVTKSEEENIMDQAIGQKIADYLIKPITPSQILLTLKKNIHRKEITTEVTQSGYRQEYAALGMQIADCVTLDDWKEVYRRLVYWELALAPTDSEMKDVLSMQKEEANNGFSKYIREHYLDWVAIQPSAERPMMSVDLFRQRIFPELTAGRKVWMVVIDNLRYDQWRVLAQEMGELFDLEEELYLSILPTSTQYARNAIFSGLMPLQIKKMYPQLWVDEEDEEGKNLHEEELLRTQIERFRRHDRCSYTKINDSQAVERLTQQVTNMEVNDLNVVVVNFVDMLSHARTESKMVRELANNESAYRSITLSWFRHSAVMDLLRRLAQTDATVMLTTDHGSIRTSKPVKIVGDRNTNTNLRYKLGKNLNYNAKEVFAIREPQQAQLPSPNVSTTYAFATGDSFFAYPNNYNYYVSYYKDTFQHGGISLEEMLVPFVTMRGRRR